MCCVPHTYHLAFLNLITTVRSHKHSLCMVAKAQCILTNLCLLLFARVIIIMFYFFLFWGWGWEGFYRRFQLVLQLTKKKYWYRKYKRVIDSFLHAVLLWCFNAYNYVWLMKHIVCYRCLLLFDDDVKLVLLLLLMMMRRRRRKKKKKMMMMMMMMVVVVVVTTTTMMMILIMIMRFELN